MKKYLGIVISFFAAVLIVLFRPEVLKTDAVMVLNGEMDDSLIHQRIIAAGKESVCVYKVYNSGRLIGVLNDRRKLSAFFQDIYDTEFKEQFPDSSVSFGKDMYLAEEIGFSRYEDIDDQILAYIKENRLFTVKATGVEFSDQNGIYAEIDVLNEEIYTQAMEEYLSYFIDPTDRARLKSGQGTPELKTYGSRSVAVSISQKITTKDVYANPDDVKMTKDEILEYLKYKDDTEKQYYTVQKYDTIAGVGAKNFGLSATQVMNINRDKISGPDQVLAEGEQLCVTYFNSPIDVVVTKESMKKEPIYAETVYVTNTELRKGITQVTQTGVNGSKNSLYQEKWVNGVLMNGTLISSIDTQQPVDEIVEVGTLVLPGIGTGSFRWPVDNHFISCGWGCYYGHRAIDIQNAYDKWGSIFASDSGVVEVNSYNYVNGNYITINHNNGYHTYYGHMVMPSPLAVGEAVEKGDVIGSIGQTGWATGPHTHFFIFDDDGNRYNPCNGFLDCE